MAFPEYTVTSGLGVTFKINNFREISAAQQLCAGCSFKRGDLVLPDDGCWGVDIHGSAVMSPLETIPVGTPCGIKKKINVACLH